MQTRSELEGLLERVRAATRADRNLDARVWAEMNGRDIVHLPHAPIGDCFCGRSRLAPHDECVLWTQHGERAQVESYIPRLSCSIDAALSLFDRALPNWSREVGRSGFGNPAWCRAWNPLLSPGSSANSIRADHNGGSEALAIIDATLQALLAQPGGRDVD